MPVIATAGHVDHGKSTLLRALTGTDPDRWAEEHRRGMTIDLGYVWLDPPTDQAGDSPASEPLVFVDVPGHHRFIGNMLAGVGPVPAALLVIAADEGWCAQTAEHADALAALDVRHGVLAVTRTDLAPAAPAIEQARAELAGTPLAGIEAVAVSGVTGAGLDGLRAALHRMAAGMTEPVPSATRLWVDRVFTVHGAGTVVTGTLTGGGIELDDELRLAGSDTPVAVRGLQSRNRAVRSIAAVARVAVNLRGVKRAALQRGDALIAPGRWAGVSTMDVRLTRADDRLPERLMLHVGSAALPVHVRPLGADTARLSIEHQLALHVGERLILRDPGRHRVVAGALVLDTAPPPLRRRGAAAARHTELAALPAQPEPGGEVARRGVVARMQLVTAGILRPGEETPEGAVEAAGWLIDERRWRQWLARLPELAHDRAAAHPLSPGMPAAAAVRQLGLPDRPVLDRLVDELDELVADGAGIHHRAARPELPPAAAAALEQLLERLCARPFAAADAGELEAAGLSEAHLAAATKHGELLRLGPGVYLRPDAAEEALRRLAALEQPFTTSQARRALDTSRRVAVPLLELLDRRRATVRVDNTLRKVRPSSIPANGSG